MTPLTRRLDGAARDAVDATRNSHSDRRRASERRDLILSLLNTLPHAIAPAPRQRGAQTPGSVLVRQLDLDRRRVALHLLEELLVRAGPGPLELLGRARFSLGAALQ